MNHLLDRLPRQTLRWGPREAPAFRALGVLGFHLALLTALLTGLRAGVPLLDTAAIAAVAGGSFFGWGLLRRAFTGRESLVLIEHVWVALGAVALLRWAAGTPVLPGLDVLAVALCPFLAVGRVGCLLVGCCHGRPAGVGVAYPEWAGLPARLTGVRLFPTPLVEAAALLGIGAAGFALAAGTAGVAVGWVLAAYATVRFGTEALRGDHRPPWARPMCVLQFAVALAALESSASWRRIAVAAAVLAAAGLGGLLLARRRRDPLTTAAHLDEVWARLRALARTAGEQPVLDETSAGLRIAVSWAEHGLHVSFSHPARPARDVPYALGLTSLPAGGLATHAVVSPTRLPRPVRTDSARSAGRYDRADSDYFGAHPAV